MPNVEIDETELANLRQAGTDAAAALDTSQQQLAAAQTAATEATTALIETLRTSNPDLPADAIAGATPAEVRASTDHARSIATHAIDAHKAANPTQTPTPTPATAGQAAAPPRDAEPNTEGLRGAARIRAGLDAAKKE